MLLPAVLLLLLLTAIAVALLEPAGVRAAGEEGYWKQIAVDTFPGRSDDQTKRSVSDGSATYSYAVPDIGDRFQSTATWNSPAATYKGGQKVELTLLVKVDEYIRNAEDTGYLHGGINAEGSFVIAYFDVAGMEGGATGGRVKLADEAGKTDFIVLVDNGNQIVPQDGGTVSAEFPIGYSDGELRAIYVDTKAGVARYTYSWTSGGEPDDQDSEPGTAPSSTESTAADEVDAEDSGCRFYSFRGEVEYLPPGGGEDDWRFAQPGVTILAGTRIRTAEESTAILQFADLSTLVLKPETEVLIKAMPKRTSNFDLVTGKIWVNIKRILKGESLEVRTDRSITGVEGTTFVLEEDGRASTLKVIDGTVRFTATSDGQTTTVEAGETVSATAEGLGEIETFDVNAEQAEWDELGADEQMEPDGFPVWLLILIIVIALALLAAVVVVLARGKRRSSASAVAPAPTGQPMQATAVELRGVVCTKCGMRLGEGAEFCRSCGQPAAEPPQPARQASFCPGCGNRLEEDARFCTRCGRPA